MRLELHSLSDPVQILIARCDHQTCIGTTPPRSNLIACGFDVSAIYRSRAPSDLTQSRFADSNLPPAFKPGPWRYFLATSIIPRVPLYWRPISDHPAGTVACTKSLAF